MKCCAWFFSLFPLHRFSQVDKFKRGFVFPAASYISSIIKCTTDKTRMLNLSQCHHVQRRLFLGVRGAQNYLCSYLMNLLNTSESFPSFPLARYYPLLDSSRSQPLRIGVQVQMGRRQARESLLLIIALPITPCSRCRAAYEGDWGLVSGYPLYRQQNNRPFYRYGGHIELIRFKEYYRMPKRA